MPAVNDQVNSRNQKDSNDNRNCQSADDCPR